MFRYLFFFSLIILIDSKTIFPWNITTTTTTTTTKKTSVFSTSTMKTSTVLNISTTFNPPMTTTIESEEELLTTTYATVNNKPYEFQSNFSRNNDSVFVSLHSNISDTFVFINNTFISDKYPCEILFNEHSNSSMIQQTRIVINFNGLFIRDLATQLGDRLIDIVDLLATVRIMANQNKTRETV